MASAVASGGGGRKMNSDTAALRSYVLAADSAMYSGLAEDMVMVNVSHSNLKQKMIEMRFDLHTTIAGVKERLRKHTGTPVDMMKLVLRTSEGTPICELADDKRMLGFYSVTHGQNLHIVDLDPHSLAKGGWLEDTSLVKKYRMSDEDYDKRKNTIRNYKREMKKTDPNFRFFPKGKKAPGSDIRVSYLDKDCVDHITIGSRCIVNPGKRRGEIKYTGEVSGLQGYWVGIALDEPMGKCDGSYNGKKYFDTPGAKYGCFSRSGNVEQGDFPPLDDLDSDFEDTDDEGTTTATASGGAGGGAGAGEAGAGAVGVGAAGAATTDAAAKPADSAAATAAATAATTTAAAAPAPAEEGDSDDEL